MSSPSALIKVNYLVIRYLHFWSVRGDLQEGNGYASRAQNRHFCARVTEDAYGDVGLEVVNVGFGKRKARIFWVCALLLICLAARSAVLLGAPFYPERRSTRSASPPPAGQETKSRGTKAGERRAGERRAGERRAGERRAVGFTGGRG